MAAAGDSGNYTSTLMQKIDGELICGICLELFKSPVMLPCSHNFCKQCVFGIIESGMSFSFISIGPPRSFNCPVCQAVININKFTNEGFTVNKALENIVSLYKTCSPVDIFDSSWNSDLEMTPSMCKKHDKPQDRFCDSCSISVCLQCEKMEHRSSKAKHRMGSLKSAAVSYQTEIADILTELKKKLIPLNDRIHKLEQILNGIQGNQDHISKKLDQQMSALMSLIRQQQEELKRTLENEMEARRQPVTEDLEECRAIKTNVQELMKKLSCIRQTKDSTLQLKLMKDTCKHLTTVMNFDIPMCLQNLHTMGGDIPAWDLDTQQIITSVTQLGWDHNAETIKAECKDSGMQTEDKQTIRGSEKATTETMKPLHTSSFTQATEDNQDRHNKKSVEGKSNSSQGLEVHDISRPPEKRRLEQRSFDEIDGDYPFVRREATAVFAGTDRVNTDEMKDEVNHRQVNDGKHARKVKLKHTDGAEADHSDGDDSESDNLNEKFEGLMVADKKRINGRRSFPLDCTPHLKNKNLSEKPNTSVTKTKKSYSDKDLNKGEDSNSYSPTNAEALAKFVARRRTMSPSVSSPSLKTLDEAANDGKLSEASELPKRKNTSSPALKSLSKTFSETDYKHDQDLNGAFSSLKSVSEKSVSKKEDEQVSSLTTVNAKTDVASTNPTDIFPVETKQTGRENITEVTITPSNVVSMETLTVFHHPKPFLKQPIGMNLDLHLGLSDTESSKKDEQKRVTEV